MMLNSKDPSGWAAVAQFERAKRLFEDVREDYVLPDAHPGNGTLPDGVCFVGVNRGLVLANFAKDVGCGMAVATVDEIPDDGDVTDVLLENDVGGGNHFLEFQEVEGEEGYIALLHCGADRVGAEMFEAFGGDGKPNFVEPGEYLPAFRKVLSHSLEKRGDILRELGVSRVVSDTVHNHVGDEGGGKFRYFLSANRVREGQIYPLPASFGRPTVYVRATSDAPCLPHGTGRLLSRGDAKKFAAPSAVSHRVVCPSESRRMSEDPRCYREVDGILAALVDAGLAEEVFRASPVVTFKV